MCRRIETTRSGCGNCAVRDGDPRQSPARWQAAFKDEPKVADMKGSEIVKRSVRIAGHATSISLEPQFWRAFEEIAQRRRVSLAQLLSAVDEGRTGNLSSAVRLFVLECCRRGELGSRE
jgi:predicted DNA-binding ribbon-helix-helix protein